MTSLINKDDLTRWNRAGLRRFRYVDGNAITYLEALRLAMREAFTQGGKNQWRALDTAIPEGVNESARERQSRWRAQYADQRRDYGWEILRTYARASHVLTEHLDAYANETFLSTATQWDNLRRLVEMLDYHPAPPASAQTPIALLAKEGKSGLVEAGFAFQNKPEDGSAPVVFETLDDLDIDAALNQIKAEDWDQSQAPFEYANGTNTAHFPLSAPVEGVSVGTLGVLLAEVGNHWVGVAVSVTSVSDDALDLRGEAKPTGFPATVKRHQVRLLLKPALKQSPQLSGSNVVTLPDDHGLSIDAVVAWQEGQTWVAARVEAVEANRAKLSRTAPDKDTKLCLAAYSDAQDLTVETKSVRYMILPLPAYRELGAVFDSQLNTIGSAKLKCDPDSKEPLYSFLDDKTFSRAYYVPKPGESDPPPPIVEASEPQGITLDGDAGELATGDWVIAQCNGKHQAASITALIEWEDSYELKLLPSLDQIDMLFGDFEIDIRPQDYNVNEKPIFETDLASRSDNHSILPLDLANVPALLDVGRTLIIAGKHDAMEVIVKEVKTNPNRIKVEPAIPGSELTADGTTQNYTRDHTIIYGNVMHAGHGETQKQSILGTGDATQTHQTFNADAQEVSFVVDGNFPPGVRAAIEITVDSRTWKQVATLNDSEPEDPHYTARIKEDGTLSIQFGDGFRGRRLPSGNNNVRMVHRKGAGLAGNLAPYSLQKAVKPHALVDAILQPLASTGGNDMETVESMRDNAPASVLTLERAVSLADFTHLAATNSSVWQARAFRRQPGVGRVERIEVAVVPAGGGSLGPLGDSLQAFLTAHALPGVKVTVIPYQSVILDLKLTLRIKEEEYDPDLVAKAVNQAVLAAFSLKNAKLGKPLYRSDVFVVVEGIEGVVNCHCEINPNGFRDATGAAITPKQVARGADGIIRRVSVAETQVIYMDQALSVLEIVTQAFSL
jgi:hypothetical protein